MATSKISFTVGETFSSFKDLEEKLKLYQNDRYVQLTHRDARTLEMARKRVPKRVEKANKAFV